MSKVMKLDQESKDIRSRSILLRSSVPEYNRSRLLRLLSAASG